MSKWTMMDCFMEGNSSHLSLIESGIVKILFFKQLIWMNIQVFTMTSLWIHYHSWQTSTNWKICLVLVWLRVKQNIRLFSTLQKHTQNGTQWRWRTCNLDKVWNNLLRKVRFLVTYDPTGRMISCTRVVEEGRGVSSEGSLEKQ